MSIYDKTKADEATERAKVNKAIKVTKAEQREEEGKRMQANINTSEFPLKGELRGDIVYAGLIELFCNQQLTQYGLSSIAQSIALSTRRDDKEFLKVAARVGSLLAQVKSNGFIHITTEEATYEQVKVRDDRLQHKIVTNVLTPAEYYVVDRESFFAWARKELVAGAKLCK